MGRKIILISIWSILTWSCQKIDKPEKPENLIEKEIMIEILVDTYLSNAARNKSFQKFRDENIRLEKYIYQKYNIDSLQFVKSNSYYSSDLDAYFDLLNQVEKRLIAMKSDEYEFESEPDIDTHIEGDRD